MLSISPDEFETYVQEAVHAIPKRFADHLENVAFMVADKPSLEQSRRGGRVHGRQVLLGLYEGIPLPSRNNGYSGVLPDVITIFMDAHLALADNASELKANVHQTVWHEVAHYFGLDHGQIRALES
jgi:predicted Zn-dependent protease with MMP-like domain